MRPLPVSLIGLLLLGCAHTPPGWSELPRLDFPGSAGIRGEPAAICDSQGRLMIVCFTRASEEARDSRPEVVRWDGERWEPLPAPRSARQAPHWVSPRLLALGREDALLVHPVIAETDTYTWDFEGRRWNDGCWEELPQMNPLPGGWPGFTDFASDGHGRTAYVDDDEVHLWENGAWVILPCPASYESFDCTLDPQGRPLLLAYRVYRTEPAMRGYRRRLWATAAFVWSDGTWRLLRDQPFRPSNLSAPDAAVGGGCPALIWWNPDGGNPAVWLWSGKRLVSLAGEVRQEELEPRGGDQSFLADARFARTSQGDLIAVGDEMHFIRTSLAVRRWTGDGWEVLTHRLGGRGRVDICGSGWPVAVTSAPDGTIYVLWTEERGLRVFEGRLSTPAARQ